MEQDSTLFEKCSVDSVAMDEAKSEKKVQMKKRWEALEAGIKADPIKKRQYDALTEWDILDRQKPKVGSLVGV